MPPTSAATISARVLSTGTSNATNDSARVKSSDHSCGISVPRKMPTAVLACQVAHSAIPAPRKYQCRLVRRRYRGNA